MSNKQDNKTENNPKQIDFQLVKRCQQGDESAFAELVMKYQKKVYLVAFGIVKNSEDAMDIAQEGFVKVHRYLNSFQGTSSFYTWLYRIIFNLCIDHLRKNGKFKNDEYDERIHGDNSKHLAAGVIISGRIDSDPVKNIGRKELGEKIMDAVNELPEYHKIVIMMREIEGMSYSDMALTLKISKGTVMSRLHHARQKLQQSLTPYINEKSEVN